MLSIAEAYDLALQYQGAGNLQQAEQIYRQILQADPRHAETLHQLGILAYQLGRYDLAQAYIDEALRVEPAWAEALNSLGIVLRAQGKLAEAVACWRQSVELKPYHPQAHSNLGLTLNELGKLDEAVASLRHALLLSPDFAEARNNLGNALQKLGQLDEAQENLRAAVTLRPDYAEAHNNLGLVLSLQRLPEQAIASFAQALRLRPNYADAHNNLGSVLAKEGRYAEATTCFERALAHNPLLAGAHHNLGDACFLTGRQGEAEGHYNRALELEPERAAAHLSRAILWLQRGDYERGWPEYEWRWRHKDQPPRPFSQPGWQGQALPGQTILVHAEQGLGDALQFVRYVPLVKERSGGATVLLECRQGLVRLLSRCPGVDRILIQDDPLPAFDVHVPLLSLPYLLGTRSFADIPGQVPYLEADPELVRVWRDRLEGRTEDGEKGRRGEREKGRGGEEATISPSPLLPSPSSFPFPLASLRVGIVWQGNPENKGDRWRSVPLDMLAPLGRIPGVSLFSLQKGPGSEQLPRLPGLAVDLGAELTDLADTAAVLKNLDLVVTVDTALAHLAGALGVPVWVALPFAPDWRWLLERDDSPWYPSARLFRQFRPQDWDDVFGRIASALGERMRHRPLWGTLGWRLAL